MAPGFLHLEDDKASLYLEELLIGGKVTKNDTDILEEIHLFYSNLYSWQNTKNASQIEQFLQQIPSLPKTLQDTSNLTGNITSEEVLTAIT